MPNQRLAIRLALHGCTNRPFYHIVVMPTYKARDHRPVEQIGTYDPMENEHNEKLVAINFDRLKHWTGLGALVSKPVEKLLGLSGFFPLHPMTYIEASRNRTAATKRAEQKEAEEQPQEQSSQQ